MQFVICAPVVVILVIMVVLPGCRLCWFGYAVCCLLCVVLDGLYLLVVLGCTCFLLLSIAYLSRLLSLCGVGFFGLLAIRLEYVDGIGLLYFVLRLFLVYCF